MSVPPGDGQDQLVIPTVAPGVAVVMPAYRLAGELPEAVEDVLHTLGEAGHPHSVIVVDDASPDTTGDVAEWLRRRFPGRVEVVQHETHRGYGAATRSGIAAALARTDHQAVLITDAGGRFPAAQLPRLLAEATGGRADVLLGYRRRWRRGGIGFIPRLLSPAILRPRMRDLGCDFTLVDRRLLEDLELTADSAAVRPELVAQARAGAARIIERRVEVRAEPRGAGKRRRPPRTALRELLQLRRPARTASTWRRDPALALVTAVAAIGSVLAFLHFLARDAVLTYPDAVAHLLIARRIVDSPTPGAAQLGGVWLPLPHVLAVPGVWIDGLYRSGLAASLVSMAAFVLTARYLYKIVDELTGRRPAAVVAAGVLALCPNVLYLQSTPMTELPLLCGIAGATYHLVRWTRTGRHAHLALTAGLMCLVTLVRYEAWVFCLAGAGVIAVSAWLRSHGRPLARRIRFAEAHLVYFGVIALAGIAGWVLWNTAIFGDPTFFYDGQYSKTSIWVGAEEATAGNIAVTLQTYWYAVADNVGLPLLVVGAAGLLIFLVRTRLRGPALAAMTPLVLLPFFLNFLYSGQRPLHVLEITGVRNNVRFGLVMIIPIAIVVGYLVAEAGRLLRGRALWVVTGIALVLTGVAAVDTAHGGIATLEEARFFRSLDFEQGNARAASWLRSHYSGGSVLMNNFGNQTVAFDSGVPLGEIVNDGSYGLWEPALADPAMHGIEWIYMRSGAEYPDPVWTELSSSPVLDGYALVYDSDGRRIYRLTSSS